MEMTTQRRCLCPESHGTWLEFGTSRSKKSVGGWSTFPSISCRIQFAGGDTDVQVPTYGSKVSYFKLGETEASREKLEDFGLSYTCKCSWCHLRCSGVSETPVQDWQSGHRSLGTSRPFWWPGGVPLTTWRIQSAPRVIHHKTRQENV